MALVMIQFTFPSNQSSDKVLREGQILIFFAHERCCLNNLYWGLYNALAGGAPSLICARISGNISLSPSGCLPLAPLL